MQQGAPDFIPTRRIEHLAMVGMLLLRFLVYAVEAFAGRVPTSIARVFRVQPQDCAMFTQPFVPLHDLIDRIEQFKLRMQKSTGQLSQTHQIQQVRRGIARVKTLLTEKAGA